MVALPQCHTMLFCSMHVMAKKLNSHAVSLFLDSVPPTALCLPTEDLPDGLAFCLSAVSYILQAGVSCCCGINAVSAAGLEPDGHPAGASTAHWKAYFTGHQTPKLLLLFL